MSIIKTLDFSQQLDRIKETEDVCHVHDTKLVINTMTKAPTAPFCLECARESLAKRNQELALAGGDELISRDGYYWLSRYSLLTDQTLKGADFDNFLANSHDEQLIKEQAQAILYKYLEGDTGNSVFTGKPGTGKSHLAMATVKAYNERLRPHKKALYISVDELFRQIQASWDNPLEKHKEATLLERIYQADLVVMDDLGAEVGAIDTQAQQKDWQGKRLYSIVNNRMDKPTIWTTNLSGAQLQKVYDPKTVSRLARGSRDKTIIFKDIADKRITF